MEPKISRITIYPIKSLDGVSVKSAMITKGGCLLHDREYAIADLNGNFITGKSNPLVHTLRSSIDFEKQIVSFRLEGDTKWNNFHLLNQKADLDLYLTSFFKMPATLIQNKEGRFMDIPDISGITILSTSSLNSISGWFNEIEFEEMRKRFRATLEIEGCPAFWEDNLFSAEGTGIEFRIGKVTLFGMSPRARCVVPTRNSQSGEVTHGFAKIFSKHRALDLPEWSTLNDRRHHYYLTVNCYIPHTEIGKFIQIGDEVHIVGKRVFY